MQRLQMMVKREGRILASKDFPKDPVDAHEFESVVQVPSSSFFYFCFFYYEPQKNITNYIFFLLCIVSYYTPFSQLLLQILRYNKNVPPGLCLPELAVL
jgi:hypothetical protein